MNHATTNILHTELNEHRLTAHYLLLLGGAVPDVNFLSQKHTNIDYGHVHTVRQYRSLVSSCLASSLQLRLNRQRVLTETI